MVRMRTMFVRTVKAVSAIVMAIVATNRLRGIVHSSDVTPSGSDVTWSRTDVAVVTDSFVVSIDIVIRR